MRSGDVRAIGWVIALAALGESAGVALPLATPEDVAPRALSLGVSASPALSLDLGFAYRWQGLIDRENDLTLTGSVGVPLFAAHRGADFDLSAGGIYHVRIGRGFAVNWTGRLLLSTAQNDSGSLVGIGVEGGLLPGYYGQSWFAALQVGWKTTLLTHVRPSEKLRDTFADRYRGQARIGGTPEKPKDGWVGSASQVVSLGLAGGLTLGRRMTLYLAGGYRGLVDDLGLTWFPDLGILPIYAEAGWVAHW